VEREPCGCLREGHSKEGNGQCEDPEVGPRVVEKARRPRGGTRVNTGESGRRGSQRLMGSRVTQDFLGHCKDFGLVKEDIRHFRTEE
jgi:hypothetical protein